MNSLTFNVPDEALAAEIDGWQVGKRYTFTADETGPRTFDLVSAEAETPAEESAPMEEAEAPMPMKKPAKKRANPAIDNYIGSMA